MKNAFFFLSFIPLWLSINYIYIMGPFGWLIFKLIKKQLIKFFVSENVWINIKIIYLHKLNNKPDPNGPLIS
jgi:hypothetical protein